MLAELAAVHDNTVVPYISLKIFSKRPQIVLEQRLLTIDAGNKITEDMFDVSLRH